MALADHLSQRDLERSLPSLRAVAFDVLAICNDPEAEVEDLVEALSRDPVLTAQVLEMANSALYWRGTPVTTLHRAAMVLRMRALKVVALGFTLANEMPRSGSRAGLDLDLYWHRSLLNAVISRGLACSLEERVAEEAFLCGLFSEIGKLVLAHAMPDEYGAVVDEGAGWPSGRLERERLGFSAGEAGELLLRGWGMPELLVLGSTYPDRRAALPLDGPRAARRLADIVALARVGTANVFGCDDTPSGAFAAEARSSYGVTADDLAKIVRELEDECLVAAEMLSIDAPQGITPDALLPQASGPEPRAHADGTAAV
jgi:hypothetical protein